MKNHLVLRGRDRLPALMLPFDSKNIAPLVLS